MKRSGPDDVAALTYDSFKLLAKALSGASRLDREAIRDALSKIREFEGVTGKMTFKEGSGDPVKSAVIMQVKGDKGYKTRPSDGFTLAP